MYTTIYTRFIPLLQGFCVCVSSKAGKTTIIQCCCYYSVCNNCVFCVCAHLRIFGNVASCSDGAVLLLVVPKNWSVELKSLHHYARLYIRYSRLSSQPRQAFRTHHSIRPHDVLASFYLHRASSNGWPPIAIAIASVSVCSVNVTGNFTYCVCIYSILVYIHNIIYCI